MGIARTIGKGLGRFLFVTFVSLSILMITIVQLTEYGNLEPLFSGIILRQLSVDTASMQQSYDAFIAVCAVRDVVEIPLGGGETITLDCDTLGGIEASDLGRIMATKMFDKIYYKEYDCDFIECLKTNQFFVIFSAKSNAFFRSMQVACLIGIAISAGILFVSLEGWPNRLKGFGMPLIGIGIFGVALPLVGDWLINTIFPGFGLSSLKEAGFDISPFLSDVFSSMRTSLLIILICGIVLTASGYILAWREKKLGIGTEKIEAKPKKK